MTTWNPQANELFLKALELPAIGPRQEYLDAACVGNVALRAEVQALLDANARAGSFLEAPALGPDPLATVDEPTVAERPGTVIGPYKLLEEIGEGGFGIVFMAEQHEPVRRKVALKVLKPGMDSRQVIARFEAERQALALMDHPNIAKVFDGGATVTGRPYFVMELVKGVPITDYCDQNQLPVRARLELFLSVCAAVQHAHQKGIIHRDLKPSNVLVSRHDTTPMVKVIDFGVAKALGQELTDKTLFTGLAQMIGTPLYMSPEQAGQSDLDIDTRSDVYSLGVLLYELLTGTTPFDRERFRQVGYDEMRRIIREEEPPKPSTRISTLGQAATTASAQRQSDSRRLSQLVRGELDWIAMKALEKDRNRRYETASAFAADVRRYLHDEPVQAGPPSGSYRLRKFVRRNRGRLLAAGALSLALLVAAAGIGWAALDRATHRAKVANDLVLALDRAELFQEQGQQPEALAAIEQAELLARDAPSGPAQDARLAAVKERYAAEARDQEFVAHFENARLQMQSQVDVEESVFVQSAAVPEIRDALRQYGIAIGDTEATQAAALIRGRPRAIRQELIAALGECLVLTPREDVQTRHWLFDALAAADQDDWRARARSAAAAHDEKALERLVGTVDVQKQPPSFLLLVAQLCQARMGSARLELLRRVQRAYPADLWSNHELALELAQTGHPAEAVRYWTAALALRPDNPGLYLNRGTASHNAGELDAAIADYGRAIALAPRYAVAHVSLGVALHEKGQVDGATAEFREALRLKPDFAAAHSNLGVTLEDKGQRAEALAEYRAAIRLQKDYAPAHYNLGELLHQGGRLDEALVELREAIRLSPHHAKAHLSLGTVLARKGRLDEAIPELREGIRLKPGLPVAHYNLGKALFVKGQWDEAIAAFREALRLKPAYVDAHLNLGAALGKKGRTDEAVGEFREALRLKEDMPLAHCNLGMALRQQGHFHEALKELRRGDELGSQNPRWRYPSAQWVRQCERLVELERRLPDFLDGKATPASPAERIELARLCSLQQRHGAAARFYEGAFAAQPQLRERLDAHRYNAACAAALAGCGRGKGAIKLDRPDRARLRQEALDWLRAELKACDLLLESAPARVAKLLQHWLVDADLAGVRGPEALAELPETERPAWQKLWDDVAGMLARAQKKSDTK